MLLLIYEHVMVRQISQISENKKLQIEPFERPTDWSPGKTFKKIFHIKNKIDDKRDR